MFVRSPEQGLFDVLEKEGSDQSYSARWRRDCFPTAISMEYPAIRAPPRFFAEEERRRRRQTRQDPSLNEIARQRGQTLAEMAVAWVLRDPRVTSALVGASKVSQVDDNVAALKNLKFSAEELGTIDGVLAQ